MTDFVDDPRAALARMAADVHQIKLEAGDTVVFSSKQIPGNEIAIGRIMNQLAAKDVLTVTEKQAHIHVSGYPGQPELAALYGWLRPKTVVPVHGEIRHMHEQARFALETGVPGALVQENGDRVYQLGDTISVRCTKTDISSGNIDFVLAETE